MMNDLNLPAGIWGTSWDDVFNENKNVQGTVCIRDGHITLDIPFGALTNVDDGGILIGSGRLSAEMLYGFLSDGRYVVIHGTHEINRIVRSNGCACQKIDATKMFIGSHKFSTDEKVEKAELSLTGLAEWIGVAPISCRFDKELKHSRYEINLDESSNITLVDNDSISVRTTYSISFSRPSVRGFRAEGNYTLDIKLKAEHDISDTIKLARRLTGFISFCRGSFSEIERLRLTLKDVKGRVEYFDTHLAGDSRRAGANDPFRPGSDIEVIQNAAATWLSFDSSMVNATNKYIGLLYKGWNMPFELQFVAATQVLDALTKDGVNLESIPAEKYKGYRNKVLSYVKESNDTSLLNWTSGKLNGNQKGQKRLMHQLFQSYPLVSHWLIPNENEFIERQMNLRNSSAHPKEEMSLTELEYWHTRAVVLLAMSVIAVKLGFREQDVIHRIEDTYYKYDEISKVKELYSNAPEDVGAPKPQ